MKRTMPLLEFHPVISSEPVPIRRFSRSTAKLRHQQILATFMDLFVVSGEQLQRRHFHCKHCEHFFRCHCGRRRSDVDRKLGEIEIANGVQFERLDIRRHGLRLGEAICLMWESMEYLLRKRGLTEMELNSRKEMYEECRQMVGNSDAPLDLLWLQNDLYISAKLAELQVQQVEREFAMDFHIYLNKTPFLQAVLTIKRRARTLRWYIITDRGVCPEKQLLKIIRAFEKRTGPEDRLLFVSQFGCRPTLESAVGQSTYPHKIFQTTPPEFLDRNLFLDPVWTTFSPDAEPSILPIHNPPRVP